MTRTAPLNLLETVLVLAFDDELELGQDHETTH
jgi:hypothetical protein